MSNLYPFAKVLWSLADSGEGTTISAAGNSGAWAGNEPGSLYPGVDQETPIDMRDSGDLALMVTTGGVTSTPTLTVVFNVFDNLGNVYSTSLTSGAITTATSKYASAGLHGASTAYLVLPRWGQVAWTCTGGTVTGTQICLYGR